MNDRDNVIDCPIKELNLELIAPSTKTCTNSDQGGSKTVVIGKPGTGKCLGIGTPIVMFDGTIKKVEDVKVGDQLMGDDSTVRNVLSLCTGTDDMYEIHQTKGDMYVVNKPHILSLKCTGYNSHQKGELLDISVGDFLSKSDTFQKRYKGYKTGVDFPSKEVALDPYMLGYWLGDGTSATSEITTIDEEVLVYFDQKLAELDLYIKEKGNSGISYRIRQVDTPKHYGNHFLNFLRDNDLLNNKHIPQVYKVNDRDTRLQMLAGLFDSDGYYDRRSNVFDFVQKSEKLADDTVFIARSLGYQVNKAKCEKSCMYKGELKVGTYFRCTISGDVDEIPCQVFRKIARARTHNKDHLVTNISPKYIGKDTYYGFQLDGNKRFLLGDFTVTHNTTLIASILYAKKHIFPVALAMSGSEDSNHYYRQIFPNSFVFNEYSEEVIESFIKRQKLAREHLENPWGVLLLDDCTDDVRIFNKPLQHSIFKKGRHWKMWYILSLQYAMDVKPVIRVNTDNCFILREPSPKIRKIIWENYAGIIPDFTEFCTIMDAVTGDYSALYIHNSTTSNKWQDCVFYYKATPVPADFKFGCKDYWNFHFDRYNTDYVEAF